MNLTLTFDYTLSPGWLAPYLDGLREGRAVAARCDGCGRVSLPPERSCGCGASQSQFVTLAGSATIFSRTSGTDGDFALVRFDGADGLSVARLDGWTDETTGRLIASTSERPALILGPFAKVGQ
jgi:uncharacterized OB-fold protein